MQKWWSPVPVLLGLLGPWPAHGQAAPDTFRLADALTLAREANPALQAARLGADAAVERIAPAGTLPNPQLAFGLMNRPLAGFGADEPMTMNTIQLTQMLPWPGKLGFARDRLRHLADAADRSADEVEARLLATVTTTYYELAAMDRALTIMDRTRLLLRDFLQVSQTRYAVGEAVQQDVLQAQIAVARMTEDITVMRQDRLAMAARLNALLGRGATVPVGALDLPPETPPLPPADSLLALAEARRPALEAARLRVAAADAGYRGARRELYPDLMLSVAWGQRPAFDDMVTLMVGFSLPLWAGRRELPVRREMAAMRAGEDAMARDLLNETFAELTELLAQADRARALVTLYRTAILPQARAAVEASLSAYRVGRVDYMTLIENEMTVNRYDIELVRLAARFHQAVAGITALVGGFGGDQ